MCCVLSCFFFQAEDGIRDLVRSRGLGDVYKRQVVDCYLPRSCSDSRRRTARRIAFCTSINTNAGCAADDSYGWIGCACFGTSCEFHIFGTGINIHCPRVVQNLSEIGRGRRGTSNVGFLETGLLKTPTLPTSGLL
mgnify:CR=1 FL=1